MPTTRWKTNMRRCGSYWARGSKRDSPRQKWPNGWASRKPLLRDLSRVQVTANMRPPFRLCAVMPMQWAAISELCWHRNPPPRNNLLVERQQVADGPRGPPASSTRSTSRALRRRRCRQLSPSSRGLRDGSAAGRPIANSCATCPKRLATSSDSPYFDVSFV
jgi:hypothetical protein